jgi:hypothetical protein
LESGESEAATDTLTINSSMRLYELDQQRILAVLDQVQNELIKFGQDMDIILEIINTCNGYELDYDFFISEFARRCQANGVTVSI